MIKTANSLPPVGLSETLFTHSNPDKRTGLQAIRNAMPIQRIDRASAIPHVTKEREVTVSSSPANGPASGEATVLLSPSLTPDEPERPERHRR